MAKYSERRERLKLLRRVLRLSVAARSRILILAAGSAYLDLIKVRYLYRGPYRSLDRADFETEFQLMHDDQFITQFRMSRESFNRVSERLVRTEVFKQFDGPRSPRFWIVLACVLYRFGHYGNGSSVAEVAQKLRVSEGTVYNWTIVVVAAVLEVKDEYIKYPDAAARAAIAAKWHALGAPPGFFVGAVDGTLIKLRYKPTYLTSAFMSRKGPAINLVIVTDSDCNILAASALAPGRLHDSSVFRYYMPQGNPDNYQHYFSLPDGTAGTYITDSGFPRRLMTCPTLTTRDNLTAHEVVPMWGFHSQLRNPNERLNGQVRVHWCLISCGAC